MKAVDRNKPGEPVVLKIGPAVQDSNYYYGAIRREVEILRKLSHCGIVAIKKISSNERNPFMERDIDTPEAPWFFGMEYLPGGTLGGYLRRKEILNLEEGVRIGLQICEAIMAVHAAGYAHNDLKPDNVLFRLSPLNGGLLEPVLIDFGIASRFNHVQRNGSLWYMAPERVQSLNCDSFSRIDAVDGRKADVWSVGVMLYLFFTGINPFFSLNDHAAVEAIMKARPRPMTEFHPDLTPSLVELVLDGCLARDPEFRPGLKELHDLLGRSAHIVVKSNRERGIFTRIRSSLSLNFIS